ncbi:hypothetical protein S1361_38205 [Streptomyces cyanogenus]|uniref:Uncharacterized protein n=1 Tax=Streptomyces cyanogenus TaxID=80860 RepID=A0ABX7TJP6_STRCY|nr:hypothetical protein S1361_00295 [Streptomyces cyanogenus]QTE03232.1 hypothetical protein S1361_38205 [Streptomyces cyanogenus]
MPPRRITEPEAVREFLARGARPLEAFPGTQLPWRCECLHCGQVNAPRYNDVVNKGTGVCRGKCRSRKLADKLMLDGTKAAATMEQHGWLPLEPYPGAAKAWRSRCAQCAAVKTKRLTHVRNGRARCSNCGGRSLSAATATATMLAAGLEPLTPYPGQQLRPWLVRCVNCGHHSTPTLAFVRVHGHQCWACRATQFPTRGGLDEEQAVACMLSQGLSPLDPYPGRADAPWKSRCITCDSDSAPVPEALPGHHQGCPVCAQQGISPVEPGDFYLVVHDDSRTLGWGVTQTGRRHLHPTRRAWRPLARWRFSAAQDAWAFGRYLKQQIRSNGCPPVPCADTAHDQAWPQTVSLDDISSARVLHMIEEVAGPAS